MVAPIYIYGPSLRPVRRSYVTVKPSAVGFKFIFCGGSASCGVAAADNVDVYGRT